ncbi:MAG: hypothetical protein ACRC6E_10480 [Fusobacteriaceae bacterium]
MELNELVDQRVFRDESEFTSGQIEGVGELINSSLDFGLTSSKSFLLKNREFGNDVAETVGLEVDGETKKKLSEDIEKEKLAAREIRLQQKNYLERSDGFFRNAGLGFVSGIAQMSTNLPEMAVNVVSGYGVGKVATSLGTNALNRAIIGITGETIENIGYKAYEKENFLEEDFTKEDLVGTVESSIGMGIGMHGLKFGIGKLISKATSPKIAESNSSKRSKVKRGTTPTEVETVSPSEIVENFDKGKIEKAKSTGIGLEKLDGLEEAKIFDGKTKVEVEEIMKKSPDTITPEEVVAIEKYKADDYDLDVSKTKEILKAEIETEGKIEPLIEEQNTKSTEVIKEIDNEHILEIQKQNEAINLENEATTKFNLELERKYKADLDNAELKDVMGQMDYENKIAKRNSDLSRKELVLAELETKKRKSKSKTALETELAEIESRLKEEITEPIKTVVEEPVYGKPKELIEEPTTPKLEEASAPKIVDEFEELNKRKNEIIEESEISNQKVLDKEFEQKAMAEYEKMKSEIELENKQIELENKQMGKVLTEEEALDLARKALNEELELETTQKDYVKKHNITDINNQARYILRKNQQDIDKKLAEIVKRKYGSTVEEVFENFVKKYPSLEGIELIVKNEKGVGASNKGTTGGTYNHKKKIITIYKDEANWHQDFTTLRHELEHALDYVVRDFKSKPYGTPFLNPYKTVGQATREIRKGHFSRGDYFELDYITKDLAEKIRKESIDANSKFKPKAIKEIPEFNLEDYKHLAKNTEIETSKTGIETPEKALESKTTKTEEILPIEEKKHFSSNKIQELGFLSALKEVKNSIEAKGLKPSRGTFRELINIHVTDHYKNVVKKTKNFLAETMNAKDGNRFVDFRETIDKIESQGFKLADILMDTDNTILKNLDLETSQSVINLKNALNSMEKNFKMFDKTFDMKKAILSSRFSRNSFLRNFGTGLKVDSNGNFDFKNITKAQLRQIHENFAFRSVDSFEGETSKIRMDNAFKFVTKLTEELKHGGLRGGAGKGSLRTTIFHKFSMLNNVIDESLISHENLSKVLGGADYSKSVHMFANLIEGLSEAKALKDTFGKDLEDFVVSGSHMRKIFENTFGKEFSTSYNVEINGAKKYFSKKMGLTPELNHPVLKVADILMSALYIPKKPFMMLKQITEVSTAALHKSMMWENGMLSAPINMVKDLRNSFKNTRLMEASEMYKVAVGGTEELLDDIMKEIDIINLKDAGTLLYGVKKAGKLMNQGADILSFMKPFESYFDKTSIAGALSTTKKWLSLGFDESTKINPMIKQAMEKVGFTKDEFDFMSKNLSDLEIADSGSIYKILKDTDSGVLKEKYTKKYKTKKGVEKSFEISNDQMALILTEKFSKLQEIVAKTGRSTKANDLDISQADTLSLTLFNKSNMFLKRSAVESTRRAYEMMIAGSQHHGAGNPVNVSMAKNVLKVVAMTPIMFYSNAIVSSTRRILTSDDDIDTIFDEEFSMLKDKYGNVEDFTDTMIKLLFKAPVESLYLNLIINSGYVASVADTITKDIAKGNLNRTAKKLKPDVVKVVENRILND